MIRRSRLIKVVFGSSAVIFILLQFLETSVTSSAGSSGGSSGSSTTLPTKIIAKNLTKDSSNSNKSQEVLVLLDETNKEVKNTLSGERIHGLPNETIAAPNAKAVPISNSNISYILTRIKWINEDQSIRNEDIFGPVTHNTTVIAIQVHNRLSYLRQLIISLSAAQGIDKTLIIFSHDFYDEAMNDLVNSVDFAKTMQIFYPYSIQTHPKEFPGESPNDCPRNAKKDQAQRLKCANAEWPDRYGHYREAKFTQTKHHWWWKANRIFDQLRVTRNHNGLVLFLEEDHYVSEDFLHVLKLVEVERGRKYSNCDIICLGTYLKSYNYNRNHKSVAKHNAGVPGFVAKPGGGGRPVPARHVASVSEAIKGQRSLLWAPAAFLSTVIEAFRKDFQLWPGGPIFSKKQRVDMTTWESAKHNMGMAFTRVLWRKIHGCREYFCNYDDYNWDWSLQHMSKQCFQTKLEVLLVKGPRVFHIGECGVHHKKKYCDTNKVTKKVKDILVKAKSYLYPTELSLAKVVPKRTKKQKNQKGNGGWGDHRDRALCMNMANSNQTSTNLDKMQQQSPSDLQTLDKKNSVMNP